MRDPYQSSEEEALRQRLADVLGRIAELEQFDDELPVPAELERLRAHGGTGWITLPDGGILLVAVASDQPGLATAAEIYRLLQHNDGAATGRVGPATLRPLPPPFAGYARGPSSVVLAGWLGRGRSRAVLHEMRRAWNARHPERPLWGVVLLPLLLAVRGLRDVTAALSALTPAASSTAAPLATAAMIATSPVVVPAVEAFTHPAYADSAAARVEVSAPSRRPGVPPWPTPPSPLLSGFPRESPSVPEQAVECCPGPPAEAVSSPRPEPSPTPEPIPLTTPSPEPSTTAGPTETPLSTPKSTVSSDAPSVAPSIGADAGPAPTPRSVRRTPVSTPVSTVRPMRDIPRVRKKDRPPHGRSVHGLG